LEVLHAEEELGEVGSLEEAGGGAICRDGLIVFPFRGEGVGEADPCGAEMGIHHAGFGEKPAGFGDLGYAEVIDANGEPGGGFVGVGVGEAVGKEEEGVDLVEFVQACEVEGEDGKVVRVAGEDRGGEGEGLFEATLGEKEFGFREEEVRVGGEVVVSGEGFRGVVEVRGVFVFGEACCVEHFCELGGFLGGRGVGGCDRVKVEGS